MPEVIDVPATKRTAESSVNDAIIYFDKVGHMSVVPDYSRVVVMRHGKVIDNPTHEDMCDMDTVVIPTYGYVSQRKRCAYCGRTNLKHDECVSCGAPVRAA
jgi:hypothetical protein